MRFIAVLLILFSCQTGQEAPRSENAETALRILRSVGDAIIRVDGMAAMQKYAPDLIPLVDANEDQVITLNEIESIAMSMQDPESLTLLLVFAYSMAREK